MKKIGKFLPTGAWNPLYKKWEFETNQGYLADAFLEVLKMFDVHVDDVYIPSFLDMSQIEFRATKGTRQQIDYVFRIYISEKFIGLWDCNWANKGTQSQVELEGGDWYAIY